MPGHYPYLLNSAIYPDYTRRPFKAPTWGTFENRTQFTTLRELHQTAWREDLDRHTVEFNLGRVIWPMLQMLYVPQLAEVIEEIRKRKLYLFDLWSYVPGSSMEGLWSSIVPPDGLVRRLEEILGERFLGIDNGEQDGRYIGGYAGQQCPNFQSRPAQYLNFHRHFERMCADLGNHMSALVSLCFGHYFLKEGNHGLLGAETAQALPNSQVYYAFIRGACKQYGVPWFGNASCFNRWGYKNYAPQTVREADGASGCGPDQGTSLALLKRLIYTHILYNSVFAGFEMGWLREAPGAEGKRWELTPIGMIQQGAVRFVEEHGSPGMMHCPVALLLDFHSGWAMPRHLYTGNVYQVWGGMPYAAGDYLTHGVLGLLYPGYEDASYYHDERGFLAPTPQGDLADVVLSDCPAWALRQYGLVVAAGALTPGAELRDTLREYLMAGGRLVVTGANARHLLPDLRVAEAALKFGAASRVTWTGGGEDVEPHAFELCVGELPPDAEVLATCSGRPAVFRYPVGRGVCTVLLSPCGLNAEPLTSGPVKSEVDRPLACPYVLTAHVRRALARALEEQAIFSAGEGLGLITCRKGPGAYTVGIHNDALQAKPFKISSRCGRIREVRELSLDQREKGQPGYWPTGLGAHDGGPSGAATIAGGDIRIFEVALEDEQLQCLPEIRPSPRPRNRFLALRGLAPLQEAILGRPTFFAHFDGVKADWRYLLARDRQQLERERDWLARQQVRIIVDFCRDLNFYPGLTLLDTLPQRYTESLDAIDGTLTKAARLGAQDAVMSLHRNPESHCDEERAKPLFVKGLREVCRLAGKHGMLVHLQYQRHRWWGWGKGTAEQALALLDKVAAPNLRLALNTGHAAQNGESPAEVVKAAGARLGLALYSAPHRDLFGQVYDAHAPVAGSGLDLAALKMPADIPQVLDGVYADADEEYRDCRAVWG